MEVILSREELLEFPLSAIEDGWTLKDGSLYLFVRTEEHAVQSIIIPKKG